MKMPLIAALLALSIASPALAAIKEESVTYKDGETTMKGFIVYDDASQGKRPGVIIVHEWWGITNHIHAEARRMASWGYTAFIADMYGDARTADNPKDAGALSGAVRKQPAVMQARFDAAMATLAKHPTVDASKIGAMGFCFGGSVVLDMARVGTDLKGVAAFHAGLGAAGAHAEPGKVKAKLLVQNGADDPFIKPDSVEAFKKEMDAAKVDYHYISYPGAVHAFTNPEATALGKKFNLPIAYNADADAKSTAEAKTFFIEVFK
jgi:dienelactone hydrolase